MTTPLCLQNALRALGDGGWHGSLKLAEQLHTPAVGSTMADLRKKGYTVECEYVGRSKTGAKLYKYRLIPEGQLDLGMSGIAKERYG
jgi:hypothetical protein